jgi:hypothetical protein
VKKETIVLTGVFIGNTLVIGIDGERHENPVSDEDEQASRDERGIAPI